VAEHLGCGPVLVVVHSTTNRQVLFKKITKIVLTSFSTDQSECDTIALVCETSLTRKQKVSNSIDKTRAPGRANKPSRAQLRAPIWRYEKSLKLPIRYGSGGMNDLLPTRATQLLRVPKCAIAMQ
jgi:hypothetical protein